MVVVCSEQAERSRQKRSSELMTFLEGQHGRYDEDHALVLVQVGPPSTCDSHPRFEYGKPQM